MKRIYTFCLTSRFSKLFILLLSCSYMLPLNGQVIHGIDGAGATGVSTNGYRVGQSFTAPEDGDITSITFVSSTTGDWELFLSEDPGEGSVISGAVYQSFAVSTGGVITVPLSTAFPMVSGFLYRFEVQKSDGGSFFIDVSNATWSGSDYDGGHETFDGIAFDGDHPSTTPSGQGIGTTVLLNDLDFEIAYLASLPVELISFRAESINHISTLTWETASEENNEGFDIEHSLDGQSWRAIGFVAGNGTTNEKSNYSFMDRNPAQGYNYYRLKQMDYDGRFEYSDIQSVVFEPKGTGAISVFPNPNNGRFTLNLYNPNQENTRVQLLDVTGRVIWNQQFDAADAPTNWQKEMDLPRGAVYFIVTQIGKEITTDKIYVNNQ